MNEVSEDMLKTAASLQPPGNCFEKALAFGETYRKAGLTPLFFLDDEETMIRVTTEEKYYGKLH